MRTHPFFKKIITHSDANNLTFPDPTEKPVNTGSREHPRKLLPIYGGYDVETTTARTPDGYRAAVYSHAFTLANSHDLHIYTFRRWSEFEVFIDAIKEYYNLDDETRLVLLVANLSFEFSFLENRFEWEDVFAKEMRQPLLARTGGLEFRECLSISGGGLDTLAKDYCYTQKLVGDLDYQKQRNYDTYIEQQERLYIYNDVIILSEFSRYLFQNIVRKNRIFPMTRTGILLKDVKKRQKKLEKDLCTQNMYHDFIAENMPDYDTYIKWFQYLFRGGYVHANAVYSNVDLKPEDGRGVDMIDITSSYPFYMVAGYVPRGKFRQVSFDPKYLKSHCCIIYLTAYNIKAKTQHTIESRNKIIYTENASYDNGRLIKADKICVMITEMDYDIYQRFYDFSPEISDFYIAERSTLPKFLIDKLLEAYIEKSKLKSEGKNDTPEYAIAKSDVNSMYGATVKRVRLDTIAFGEDPETALIGWYKKTNDKTYTDEAEKQILLPQWGIWITSGARYRLLKTVDALTRAGVKCIYHDTDSIKYIRHPSAARIIKRINKAAARILKKRGYTDEYLRGLGEFEYEIKDKNKHPIAVRFKTLGAKRYIYFDPVKNKVIATIAGLPKTAINALGDSLNSIFTMFSDAGFNIACEETGKLHPVYCDTPYKIYVDGQWMCEQSGCALVETPFSLSLKSEYYDYIHQLQQINRIGGTI